MQNADKILFRCSSLHHLMSDPKSKADKEAGLLSEGAKTHCVDVFISAKYKRREEIDSKFLRKGNAREEDSITLYARNKQRMFHKNSERLNNEYFTGEPDLFIGESIRNADETIDCKTSWSAHTFFRATSKALADSYYWQGVGYMALTGAKKHTVAYCLVNGTAEAINSEKRKVSYQPGMLDRFDNESPEFKERCKQIEINHIFDIHAFRNENPDFDFHTLVDDLNYDIPMSERLFTFEFERNEADIQRACAQVMKARIYLNKNLFKL